MEKQHQAQQTSCLQWWWDLTAHQLIVHTRIQRRWETETVPTVNRREELVRRRKGTRVCVRQRFRGKREWLVIMCMVLKGRWRGLWKRASNGSRRLAQMLSMVCGDKVKDMQHKEQSSNHVRYLISGNYLNHAIIMFK